MTLKQLRALSKSHKIGVPQNAGKDAVLLSLMQHACSRSCGGIKPLVFRYCKARRDHDKVLSIAVADVAAKVQSSRDKQVERLAAQRASCSDEARDAHKTADAVRQETRRAALSDSDREAELRSNINARSQARQLLSESQQAVVVQLNTESRAHTRDARSELVQSELTRTIAEARRSFPHLATASVEEKTDIVRV
jgi:hypothetical protein